MSFYVTLAVLGLAALLCAWLASTFERNQQQMTKEVRVDPTFHDKHDVPPRGFLSGIIQDEPELFPPSRSPIGRVLDDMDIPPSSMAMNELERDAGQG